jgi:hypothetical protein
MQPYIPLDLHKKTLKKRKITILNRNEISTINNRSQQAAKKKKQNPSRAFK